MEASAFNFSAQEFVPLGKMAKTSEQFPELGDMMDEPKKKTKKGKNKKG